MSIRFWVAEYSTGITVKSDLIVTIDKLFKENNIVIPFPQQDVYVKSLPEKMKINCWLLVIIIEREINEIIFKAILNDKLPTHGCNNKEANKKY